MLESDDQKKDQFNSLQRIQNLMARDTMYSNKAQLM